MYGSETRTMAEMEMKRLGTGERKVLIKKDAWTSDRARNMESMN